jgi:ferrochelatase
VIETPKAIWWFILNGIVLRTRPAKSAKGLSILFGLMMDRLYCFTLKKQKNLIKEQLEKKYPNLVFDIGMRYGNPSIAEGFE